MGFQSQIIINCLYSDKGRLKSKSFQILKHYFDTYCTNDCLYLIEEYGSVWYGNFKHFYDLEVLTLIASMDWPGKVIQVLIKDEHHFFFTEFSEEKLFAFRNEDLAKSYMKILELDRDGISEFFDQFNLKDFVEKKSCRGYD